MGTVIEIRKYRCEWCELPRNHEGPHVVVGKVVRQPAWILRMQQNAKDFTGKGPDAA